MLFLDTRYLLLTTQIRLCAKGHHKRLVTGRATSSSMAPKRRGTSSQSSTPHPSFRPQVSFSRMSSVLRELPIPSPIPNSLPGSSRLSLSSSSRPGARSSDVVEFEEADVDIHRREDADAMNEIIMALDIHDHGTVGCAYYIAREEKLCLMADIKMADIELVDTLKLHALPTGKPCSAVQPVIFSRQSVILISNRCEEEMEERLKQDARGIDRGDDASKLFFGDCARHTRVDSSTR